jgi:hypothetical protein
MKTDFPLIAAFTFALVQVMKGQIFCLKRAFVHEISNCDNQRNSELIYRNNHIYLCLWVAECSMV